MAVPKLWFLEMWAQMSEITNQTRDFSQGSGSTNVCQELLRSTQRSSLWMLSFTAIAECPSIFYNSNLSREMCFNPWLHQDSRICLLEVLNRPTTDVDFWAAFLRGKDGWLQPLKLYATYSGMKQLSGKTKTTWNRSALVEVLCG